MGIERKIASLETFLNRLDFPLQPHNYEAKVVLDVLFEKGGFLNLCDLLFGDFGGKRSSNKEEELTWMDIANAKPNGKIASSIFRLLAPGGRLCNLLEAVSMPTKDFSTRLKSSWKGDVGVESDVNSQSIKFFIPLSTLYASSYELIGETANTNWYSLPRARCPSLFLVPFWCPPLVTRPDSDTREVLTSLPCYPLPYFVLRMLLYVVRRAERYGVRMVRRPNLDTLSKKIGALLNYVKDSLWNSSCVELPFYHRLLTAYIQYFVSTSFIKRSGLNRSLEEVQWFTPDVTAALLLSAPSLLWMRNVRQPNLEIHRVSCRDVVTAALVFRLIPFLTECFITLTRMGQENLFKNDSTYSLMIRKDFFNDSVALSAWDILSLDISFYRNTLIALRQSLISLDSFAECRREHYNNTLELWYTMIKPNENIKEVSKTYVIQHYEVYSFLLIDVFSMILKGNFLGFIDIVGATMLSKCIEVYSIPSLQVVFSEISNSEINSLSNLIDAITQYFTLNWTNEDGSIHVLRLFGDKTLELAAEVYLAVESRLELGNLDSLIIAHLEDSLGFLEKAFNGLPSVVKNLRDIRAVTRRPSVNSQIGSSLIMKKAEINTKSEKELYFKGIQRSCGFTGPLSLKFATENNVFPGGHNPLIEASCSNEFPFLLGLTRFIDTFIEKILEIYYSSWIPTCSRGHNMWLLSSSKYSCINHPRQPAVWECLLCEEVYGVCCRSHPHGKNGEELIRLENIQYGNNPFCQECFSVFQPNDVVYSSSSSSSKETFCPDCASRPFKKRSSRFLAAYTTWAIFFFIALMIVFIYSV
ncbi:hypothetical protein LSM04_000723 [Trypanosoma melophagium]|uniref:uncharacterized protein n=1 Tax=Trypanosoma melophagium TaxID=715481 RepID=UPI00351A4D91|nr:hypothetical protein LSM04_000723 [Trypanosoma melophagium]